MGQLTNLYVSESYQGLIKLTDSTTGVTGTLQYLQDGIGNRLPIQMSTSSVSITGSLHGTASYATQALSASYAPVPDVSGFATTGSNTFYGNQSIISPNAEALFVSGASQRFRGNSLSVEDNNSVTKFIVSNASNIVVSDLPVSASQGITGSLFGTASYATQALSASWAPDTTDTGSLVTTSSFNAFTASIDGRVDALEVETGSLQNQINQKLNTSSFNSYTSSNDARVTSLESKTGSYATTGSNNFVGQQNINGSVNVTGSLNVTDSITALSASITYLKTIYQTSSVIFTSGSNILGDEASDTQTLWGTVKLPTGPLSVTGSATISSTLNVQTALTASGLNYPTADNGVESFMQTDGAGNLSLKYVKTLYQNIRNMETSSIAKGTPLFVSGNTGDNSNVYVADASNPNRMPVTLVAGDSTLAPSATGKGIILGHIEGVDTTGYAPGTVVYVGVGGGWTSVRPTGSTVQVQELGIVTREGTNGMGIVLTVPPTTLPNTQTGYVWVGNGNNYPVQAATSSLSVASAVSSSFATNAISSSHSVNSDVAISSSFAQNALSSSHSVNSDTSISSSYSLNSTSASFAQNALSASYAPDTTNTGSLVTNVALQIATNDEVVVTKGDGSTSTFTINNVESSSFADNATSASFATNALSASYAPGVSIPAGTVSGSAQIVDLGFATTSSLAEYLLTSSFNTYTASMDARTGSYATTGSNLFKGDQTISGSINLSGSIYMKQQANTGLDYVTASASGNANFLIGANGSFSTNSGSFVITGSNNFVTAQFPRTVGYINYINGHGNVMLGSAGVLLSTSSIATSVSANIGGGSMTLNFGTSSLAAPIVGNNQVLGGPNFNSPSGSMNAINNQFIGSVTYRATGSTHNTLSSMVQNIFNSSPVFNAVSSSIAASNNTFGGGTITINNNYTSSNTSGNQLAVNRTAIFGQSITLNISGSNDGSTNFRAVNDNLIAGISHIVNSSAVGTTSGSLNSTMILGGNLVVSASNRAGGNDVGSVFLGRNNDTAQGLSESTTTVLAVGTGTSTGAKRTSLHVSSSGLFQIRHSAIISGSLTHSGSVYLTGSVQGNVLPLTVSSNTASLNLDNGNFFELALTGSSDIRIEPSNIKPGQTVNIKLNTTGSGTVSFPTSVKQPSGSAYVPTTAVGTDIITMVSFDSTNLYVANVKNLI
jgi:hypothetical protein